MAISDIFSTSFLFSIAIIIILIGGIFAYVSYRMSEQDHKLTSMVNLVSILAQDLQFVKSKLNTLQHNTDNNTSNNLEYPSEIMGGQRTSDLISVSDGEDEESDNEDDEDNTSDEEYSDDNDNDDDDDDDDQQQLNDSQEQIKLLNLTLANEDIENDSPIEDLAGDFEPNDTLNSNDDIKTIHLEIPITFEETDIPIPSEPQQNDVKISSEDMNFLNKDSFDLTNGSFTLKNVTITDLGEADDQHASKSEYKKMSINKLREVVVTKGLISDASKLKKNEILKMLGDD